MLACEFAWGGGCVARTLVCPCVCVCERVLVATDSFPSPCVPNVLLALVCPPPLIPSRRLTHLFAPSVKLPSAATAAVFGAGPMEAALWSQASVWRREPVDEYGSEYSESTSEDFGTEDEEIREGRT